MCKVFFVQNQEPTIFYQWIRYLKGRFRRICSRSLEMYIYTVYSLFYAGT